MQGVLCILIASCCRHFQPFTCLAFILRYAKSMLIHFPDTILRKVIALHGRFCEPKNRSRLILYYACTN